MRDSLIETHGLHSMIKTITAEMLAGLSQQARSAERRRAHLNVHDSLEAPVQRLFIAMEPGTYIRPHRHPQANKWEFFLLVEGEIDLLVFDDDGVLQQRTVLSASRARAVELQPGTWHTYVSQAEGTVVLEVKEGPYLPTPGEDFAPWAPAENSAAAGDLLAWLQQAQPGDRWPGGD